MRPSSAPKSAAATLVVGVAVLFVITGCAGAPSTATSKTTKGIQITAGVADERTSLQVKDAKDCVIQVTLKNASGSDVALGGGYPVTTTKSPKDDVSLQHPFAKKSGDKEGFNLDTLAVGQT
jgi:hypothetical protein